MKAGKNRRVKQGEERGACEYRGVWAERGACEHREVWETDLQDLAPL